MRPDTLQADRTSVRRVEARKGQDAKERSWLAVAAGLKQGGERDQADARIAKEPTRHWLLEELRRVMQIALDRVTNPKTPANDRIKWSRIVIAAGGACNSVLRDVEIDQLRKEISELRALTEAKLKNESGTNQARDTEAQEED